MKQNLKKVHIIGGPGSGKTFLARQLAQQVKVSAYDLDVVGYEGGSGPKRALDLRLADLERIAAESGWVTEGIYLGWTDRLLNEADLIIWLDLSWWIAAWRIVKRHALASLAGTNRHPGLLKLFRFVIWSREYYYSKASSPVELSAEDSANSRAATAQYLAAFEGKVLHCRRPSQVKKFL